MIYVMQFVLEGDCNADVVAGDLYVKFGEQWVVYTVDHTLADAHKLTTTVTEGILQARAQMGDDAEEDDITDYLIEYLARQGYHTPILDALVEIPLTLTP